MTSIAREVQKHLEAQRKPRIMNRQSRVAGRSEWRDYGPVSLNDAAVSEAKLVWFHSPNRIAVTVEVRCADHPDKTWEVVVEREVSYRVRGLRGGDQA